MEECRRLRPLCLVRRRPLGRRSPTELTKRQPGSCVLAAPVSTRNRGAGSNLAKIYSSEPEAITPAVERLLTILVPGVILYLSWRATEGADRYCLSLHCNSLIRYSGANGTKPITAHRSKFSPFYRQVDLYTHNATCTVPALAR